MSTAVTNPVNGREVGAAIWSAQTAVIDFASPDSGHQFGDLVEQAHEKSILYLDWTMKAASRSGLFAQIAKDGDPSPTDEVICEHVERKARQPGGLVFSGKADPDNDHLLFETTLDLSRGAPFARARCEYVDGTHALRMRGFFYVTNIRTATASNLEFQPVSVPIHRVPETFLEYLR